MLRILLIYVLPLLAPFALYELWRMFAPAKYGGNGTGEAEALEETPWPWLAGAGVVLVAVTVVSLALFSDWEEGSVYQPPQLIDGEVQPGRFVKPGGR